MDTVEAHIYYSGTVQGVGFRYTVERYANDLNLVGWVKNLPDGRVEARIEGSKEAIAELCKKIERHFDGYIKGKEIEFSEGNGRFKSFEITF